AGTGRGEQVELRGRRFQCGAPPFQLVVTKADPRALDLEAVVPHVRQARYADTLLQVGQRAAGDDHDVEIRRAGRLIERLAGRFGQLRVLRPGHDRRQGPVVVE